MKNPIYKSVVYLIAMITVAILSLTSCVGEYISTDIITDKDKSRVVINEGHWQDLNLIILPEAYRAEDMENFKQDVAKVYNMLQNVKPYCYMLDRITVSYSTACVSQSNELGSGRTALGCGVPDDRVLALNNDSITKAIKWLKSPAGNDVVLVIVNTDAYIGCTLMSTAADYMPVAVCAANDYCFITAVIHELGHAIGQLEDEYVEYNTPIPAKEIKSLKGWQKAGFFLNVSLDATNVYWKRIIEDVDYQHEGTGVYEGGGLYASGVYRSTENSVMRTHNRPDYNAVSRYLIYQQVMKCHTGVEPLYSEFKREDLAYPDKEWDWQSANKPTNPKRKSAPARQDQEMHHHHCIVWR